MSDIETLLTERGKSHGKFSNHARCTQRLKAVVYEELQRAGKGHHNNYGLTFQQREALDMILHKIGRITAGDPNVKDHWDDIAGYATIACKDF
jgi:hypothetical protein